jgi:hypothetical protein
MEYLAIFITMFNTLKYYKVGLFFKLSAGHGDFSIMYKLSPIKSNLMPLIDVGLNEAVI